MAAVITYVPQATHSMRSVSPTIGLVGNAFGKLLTISGSCWLPTEKSQK